MYVIDISAICDVTRGYKKISQKLAVNNARQS